MKTAKETHMERRIIRHVALSAAELEIIFQDVLGIAYWSVYGAYTGIVEDLRLSAEMEMPKKGVCKGGTLAFSDHCIAVLRSGLGIRLRSVAMAVETSDSGR